MRFSTSGLVAASTAVAALLLAACAGQSTMPAATSFAPSAPSAVSPDAFSPDAKKPTPGPCDKKQTPWQFMGACGTAPIKATGGSASMTAYNGFVVKALFPKANPAPVGTALLVVRDATDTKKDVTGLVQGKTFPIFNKAGAPPQTVKPMLYFKAHNQGGSYAFTATPQLTVTSKTGFPGKLCFLTKMNPTNNTWQTWPAVEGKITGNTVVFPSQTTQIQVPKNGTIYLAIACFTP